MGIYTDRYFSDGRSPIALGSSAAIAVIFVGAGSPEFIPLTNNLNKPALTQGLNEINWQFLGGDGAGFLACLFGGTDIGEPAPTGIM